MATPPKMLDLARRLVTYEAVVGKISNPMDSAPLRVYEKLRQGLGQFAGVAVFQSLASRALALANSEAPSLGAARVTPDGCLLYLDKSENQIDVAEDRAGAYPLGEEGTILIAHLLGLLLIFLGEVLTLSLLRVTWPGEALDNCNSENGRKA